MTFVKKIRKYEENLIRPVLFICRAYIYLSKPLFSYTTCIPCGSSVSFFQDSAGICI